VRVCVCVCVSLCVSSLPSRYHSHDYTVVNAYYDPTFNSINLLAGLIQYPMASSRFPFMFNTARYGYVIGHELTHGFDNSGRLYNGTGAYVNWWKNESIVAFDERAQCLVDLYDSFEVVPGHYVNGQQTLGENIADEGGSMNAWQAFLQEGVPSEPLVEGYTNKQLFWVFLGQSWCEKKTPAAAIRQLKRDVHSPGKWRVNGVAMNNPGFADAFNCPASSFMGRSKTDKRCILW
jgi:predicted metalloendopeptidase